MESSFSSSSDEVGIKAGFDDIMDWMKKEEEERGKDRIEGANDRNCTSRCEYLE